MSYQTQTSLTATQASIYSRTNIRRAFLDFDDTDVAGIYLRDDSCVVAYHHGGELTYPREVIKTAFKA